ncbi:MAG: hypothetical protein WCA78_15695 [Rhizomicrobium sp.]
MMPVAKVSMVNRKVNTVAAPSHAVTHAKVSTPPGEVAVAPAHQTTASNGHAPAGNIATKGTATGKSAVAGKGPMAFYQAHKPLCLIGGAVLIWFLFIRKGAPLAA